MTAMDGQVADARMEAGGRPAAGVAESGGGDATVTVLGTSGSYPGPRSACSGYLLRAYGFSLWLDAGPGTMANLQTHVDVADVDAVVLSHEHPDHWSDLDGFYIACRYIKPRSRVPIYAPAGLQAMMRSQVDTDDTFIWHDITDKTSVPVGPFDLTFSRTDHPPETLAVRAEVSVRGGRRAFGYTADSGPGWTVGSLGSGLDLLISEATFLHDREGTSPHISGRQAGAFARQAGVRRLLVSHIWPIVSPAAVATEASETFGAPVSCAQVNTTYDL